MADSQRVPDSNPAEVRLAPRDAEFEELSRELARKELQLATLQNRLLVFERRYANTVGVLFAELDSLGKQIAAEQLRLHPDEEEYREGFQRAERKARASQDGVDGVGPRGEGEAFRPSEELRNLYRKVAKAVHPDLATDEADRAYRNTLMARANEAYRNGDLEALRQILNEWEQRGERPPSAEARPALSDRMTQRISQIRARIREIDRTIAELKQSELYQLMLKVEQAEEERRDLLGDMARDLQHRIRSAKTLLESLRQQ